MKCENCHDWFRLGIKRFNQKVDNVAVTVNNVPVLTCPTCNAECLPDKSDAFVKLLAVEANKNKKRKIAFSLNLEEERKRYRFCAQVTFIYDSLDYEYIPGLMRPSNDGFLTPVFFKIEVLIKYLNHPEYSVEFASNTYGSIYHNHKHMIFFGLNRNNRVIMWLGDIDKLPDEEQHYLRSENIESDHDISSEFYQGQIEVEFTDLSDENEVLKLRAEFEKYCNKLFGIEIYQLDIEVVKIMKDIRKPITYTENAVGSTIQALNKVLVESINSDSLKDEIAEIDPKFEAKGSKGLKLFEKWIQLKFPALDSKVVMCPFFVLYDMRLVISHVFSTEKAEEILDSCCERLKLPAGTKDNKRVYNSLIERLINSFKILLKR